MHVLKKGTFLIPLYLFTMTLYVSNGYANVRGYEEISDKNPFSISSPALKNVKTKKIRLSNALEAYIISDPNTTQCAAGLSVGVGSFYDPPEYPGMAHYVEHAVFMGNEKYPDENAFFECVQDSQGMANAYTKSDMTVYMFSCNPVSFSSILDQFAHFFIDPLFRKDALARELNAVDNEHKKNIKNDDWRAWQVYKETANKEHPVTKFSTGTKETLEIIPRELLVEWYRRNYSADRMHLVIYTNETVESTATMISEIFSEVPVSENPDELSYSKMSSSNQEGHITYITPIKDIKRMIITWELPKQTAQDLDAKPAELIAYTLASPHESSLIEVLKKEGLATSIGYDIDTLTKDHKNLTFIVSLTKKGVGQSDIVLYRFYQALNQLKQKSIPAHIYHEGMRKSQHDYEWQSRTNPFHVVGQCADQMAYESLSTFPYKSITASSFQPKHLRDTLAFITPWNAQITIQAPTDLTKQKTDQKEKWMGVEYTIVKIDREKLSLWDEVPFHSEIRVCPPNPFMASKVHLNPTNLLDRPEKPVLLSKESNGICYFAKDSYYLVPETTVQIGLKSQAIEPTAKSHVLKDLYVYCMAKSLTPLTSTANRAGINTTLSGANLKVSLSISGYNEKLDVYLSTLLDRFKNTTIKKFDFERAKEAILARYMNQEKELPIYQAFFHTKSLLYNDSYAPSELISAFHETSFEDLQKFSKQMKESNFLEVMIGGNLDKTAAKNIWETTKRNLSGQPADLKTLPKRHLSILRQNKGAPYSISYNTPLIGNSVVLILQTGEAKFEKIASSEVLRSVLQEAFFTELRTNQQIAYIAFANSRECLNEVSVTLALHSATHSTHEILARFDLFLENYTKNLPTEISLERFEMVKQNLLYLYQKPPENLSTYLEAANTTAFDYNADFYRREKLIEAIQNLSYETFLTETRKALSRSNQARLAVMVNGTETMENPYYYQNLRPEEFLQKVPPAITNSR